MGIDGGLVGREGWVGRDGEGVGRDGGWKGKVRGRVGVCRCCC